jgi:hypothetical protein
MSCDYLRVETRHAGPSAPPPMYMLNRSPDSNELGDDDLHAPSREIRPCQYRARYSGRSPKNRATA